MSAVTLVCKADFVYILSLSCFAFIFVKYLFLRIILISVACSQYLVSTDLPLLWKTAYFLGAVMFPSHPPCDVHEWSWHLILCRYSFVWYDCASSFFAFQRKLLFRFSIGPICAAERATVRDSACALLLLTSLCL